MVDNIRAIVRLVDRRDTFKVIALLILMTGTAFLNMFGVASVMPFLSVLADPQMVHDNAWLSAAFAWLGFQSTEAFLFFLGASAFTVFLLGTMTQALSQWAMIRFSHGQQYWLSKRLMTDYLRRPYSFYLNRNSSDLAKSVLEETQQAVNGALLPALRLVIHGTTAVAIIVLLLLIRPWLALVTASVLGVVYGAIYLLARRWLERIGKIRLQANRARFAAAGEAFAGAKEIRLLGRERAYLDRYQRPARQFAHQQANVAVLSNLPQYAIEAVAFGGVMILVLYLMSGPGGLATALPIIGVYALAAKKLIPAFQQIFASIARLRFTMPAVHNLLADLGDGQGVVPLPLRSQMDRPLVCNANIRFEGVTFTYPGAPRPALTDLNLTVPAFSSIGLVGSSGAGKSTLVDLLLGLLEPAAGAIYVDGQRLTEDNLRRWQATLGYVPQHIFLADDSVAANIALGVPEKSIDMAAVERAAKMANLHDFVLSELPQGYQTEIGDRGLRLSGGQRQRIGIARALYRDPSVLVFDEATSALDNATERAVMEAVHNLSKAKTVILVAHRLSTVEPCDQIAVLHDGRLVDQGAWDVLMQESDHFRRLAEGLKTTGASDDQRSVKQAMAQPSGLRSAERAK
ncbi:ABC transporter ATP-binding protein [Alkalilimnicola ehrlichii MLHE-1]|uniref:ABC transporter related protein n=1 Tax=Alkalilimnicola ehrlichii (strain ATCC BAA-1101 / DSM 17681 / MLHE-1) TaxID=187272 RepID=Q0ACG0_ALKEH|nr:ABC transporter ATP-binding protein [Alkalilimnicola ehrlichii]ABI55477.1 ABC transporter related protein [Alkalilimnicola ehrlichii MLHE-1]